MARVLLVDDDVRLSAVIEDVLTDEGHVVEYHSRGLDAWEKMLTAEYDIIVLDWNLPDATGPDLCIRFRAEGKYTPVLLLTGRDKTADKVEGLDAGADDFLTKPFNMQELSARVRALLRRFQTYPVDNKTAPLSAGDLVLDRKSRSAIRNGSKVPLLPKEFALLEFFMLHPEQVFSANEILDKVWSEENETSPDTVRVHITKLRSKLGGNLEDSPIKTLHRVGYMFSPSP
jgi:OmpR-family two-component system manganese-sensing response regulator